MKKRGKKLLSYLLALVLVLGIVPWISLTAKATDPEGDAGSGTGDSGTWTVTITAGSNMTTSGEATQNVTKDQAMTDVVYTAAEGYYFPEGYSVTGNNGISVKRDNYTQITVSGTPTANATVNLDAPTEKTKPEKPTGVTSTNCTTSENNDGKLTGVTIAMQYRKSDEENWTDGTDNDITGLAPGTYYVRFKATDTTLPSDNQELTVAAAESAGDSEAQIGETKYTTLSEAITAANSGDTIKLLKDVTITEIITLPVGITIEGNSKSITRSSGQVFKSQSGVPVIIKDLTIKGSGQALEVPSGSTVILENCKITECQANYAAAIQIYGTVVLDKTIISGNSTTAENAGGVIELGSSAKLYGMESVISNNTAQAHTGGINNGSGTVYLMKCCVTGNNSNSVAFTYLGGGVCDGANLYAANCVIAGNKSGPRNDDTLDIGDYTPSNLDSPTLRNCIYGKVSKVDDTKVTGSTGGGSGTEDIPSNETEWSYTVSGGQLNITMSYKDEAGNMQVLWAKPSYAVTTAPSPVSGLTYTGSAQALVNGGTANGGTLVYAVGTNATTAPTEGWSSDIPKGTAAGTYYVWYKVQGDSDHSDSTAKCITVTIQSQGGGGGSYTPVTPSNPATPTEEYTVPVTGENTVNVKAEITDGTAKVDDIPQSDLDKIVDASGADATGDPTSIIIDISGAKTEVDSVELSKETTEKLADIVNDDTNNINGVEIRLNDATVELDGKALEAIIGQAEGNSVKVLVNNKNADTLNAAQQTALGQFESASPFQVSIVSNGEEIHDFKGGTAVVSVKYEPEIGMDPNYLHVVYLDKAGELEWAKTLYENELLKFRTGHCSDYAIVYDESKKNGGTTDPTDPTDPTNPTDPTDPTDPNEPAKTIDMFRLYNPNSGEHFYTGNEDEKDHLVSLGWNFEGIAWTAPAKSNTPVYRLYNPNAGDHHYTMSEAEKDWLVGLGWNYEGIGWYSVVTEREPIYRLYNPNATTGTHHYTASEGERDYLISLGWRDEKIGWYGLGEDAA